MDVKEKLVELLIEVACKWGDQIGLYGYMADRLIADGWTKQECGNWKYYHKQNKAVCTNCSFERDLDANVGRAIACPNCGAYMPQPPKGE